MVQKKAIRYEMSNTARVVSPYVLCHTGSVKSSAKRRSSKRPPNLTNLGRASTPAAFRFDRPNASTAVTRILCLAQIKTAGQDEKYGNASPSFDQRRPHPADVR